MREYFNPDWAEYSFGVLFMATWQAAVLVGFATVASACMRRATLRGAIWWICVLGLATVPGLSLLVPHCFVAYRGPSEPLHFPSNIARPITASHATGAIWTLGEGGWDDRVCRTLLFVWLGGVAVALVRLAWNWFDMARILRMARPVRCTRVQAIARKVLGQADRVLLLELDGLVGAICWQIHRPKMILTADTGRLSDDELEMMIRHEWAHLQRDDPMRLFVQRLVEIMFWFHPLVWWASLQISKYREFICDDRVVEAGHAPLSYACCLGQLAVRYYSPVPVAPAGLGLVWSQHLVLLRVKRLMRGIAATRTFTRAERTGLGLCATMTMVLVSLLRIDWVTARPGSGIRWTAWPTWSASALDAVGLGVRDFPLDAHLYDPGESQQKRAAIK